MKQAFAILLLLLSNFIWAQTAKHTDTVNFCNIKFIAPPGCKTEPISKVRCDNYSIQWLYLNDAMLKTAPAQFVAQLAGQMKKFKQQPITLYLLGKEVNGYKLSFKSGGNDVYQLLAYGVANNQPVFVQVVLDTEPVTNNDLPQFVQQIVTLTK